MWFFGNKQTIADVAPALPLIEVRKRAKIVVVDDEEDSFPTRLLRDDGYTIEWWPALDAHKLDRLERGDFDIIVLDIQGIADSTLSDTGDGLGVLRWIKSVNPYQLIVAFSGKAYDLDKVPFWRAADEAMGKPISTIKAKEVIDRLIQEHVNVERYWQNVEGLLVEARVPTKRIARLEAVVVGAARKGEGVTMEKVKSVVGGIEKLATIGGFIDRIISLCRTLV